MVCKPEDSLFVARFLERPETKVHIDGPLTPAEVCFIRPFPFPLWHLNPIIWRFCWQQTFSPDLIINGILNILTSTLVDLNFCFATNFPKYPNSTLSSAIDSTHEVRSLKDCSLHVFLWLPPWHCALHTVSHFDLDSNHLLIDSYWSSSVFVRRSATVVSHEGQSSVNCLLQSLRPTIWHWIIRKVSLTWNQ